MAQNYISPTTAPTSNPASDQQKIADNDEVIRTNFSGATAPVTPVANQYWADTGNDLLLQRNSANTEWVVVSNLKNGISNDISSNYSLSAIDNGKTFLVTASLLTITLPIYSTVPKGYDVRFMIWGDTTTTFSASVNFIRNGTNLTSYQAVNQTNNEYHLTTYGPSSQFMLSGIDKGMDANLSSLTNAGKKVMLDLLYPVGSMCMQWQNITPPLHGVLGVSWSIVAEGLVPMAANTGNVNIVSGANRADTGVTVGHAITIAQMPGHTHNTTAGMNQGGGVQSGGDNVVFPLQSITSTPAGGNQTHTHPLSIFNYKVIMYRRIS